jgi:hypothetical protein
MKRWIQLVREKQETRMKYGGKSEVELEMEDVTASCPVPFCPMSVCTTVARLAVWTPNQFHQLKIRFLRCVFAYALADNIRNVAIQIYAVEDRIQYLQKQVA